MHLSTQFLTGEIMQRTATCIFSIAIFLFSAATHSLAQEPAEKAWTVINTGLEQKGEDRINAVKVLGLLEYDHKAAQLALTALADTNPEVRAAAASALGQMKEKSALPKLEQTAKTDLDPSVVLAAGHALYVLGDPLGYAVYYAVLTGERKSGESLMEEQKKMLHDPKKMAQFGFEEGIGFVPFAGIGWGAFKMLSKDDVSPVRAAAAHVLSKDPDPKSAEALVEAAADKSWIVRAAALGAISDRDDPSLIPKILGSLDDDKAEVRFTAAAAIIHLHDVSLKRPHEKTPSTHAATTPGP
jgi:HEAT repeat protein